MKRRLETSDTGEIVGPLSARLELNAHVERTQVGHGNGCGKWIFGRETKVLATCVESAFGVARVLEAVRQWRERVGASQSGRDAVDRGDGERKVFQTAEHARQLVEFEHELGLTFLARAVLVRCDTRRQCEEFVHASIVGEFQMLVANRQVTLNSKLQKTKLKQMLI